MYSSLTIALLYRSDGFGNVNIAIMHIKGFLKSITGVQYRS